MSISTPASLEEKKKGESWVGKNNKQKEVVSTKSRYERKWKGRGKDK